MRLKANPFGNWAWTFCRRPHWSDAEAAAGHRVTYLQTIQPSYFGQPAPWLTWVCQEKSQSYRNLPYFQHLGSDEVFEAGIWRIWDWFDWFLVLVFYFLITFANLCSIFLQFNQSKCRRNLHFVICYRPVLLLIFRRPWTECAKQTSYRCSWRCRRTLSSARWMHANTHIYIYICGVYVCIYIHTHIYTYIYTQCGGTHHSNIYRSGTGSMTLCSWKLSSLRAPRYLDNIYLDLDLTHHHQQV
jgi:hypothetical protein